MDGRSEERGCGGDGPEINEFGGKKASSSNLFFVQHYSVEELDRVSINASPRIFLR